MIVRLLQAYRIRFIAAKAVTDSDIHRHPKANNRGPLVSKIAQKTACVWGAISGAIEGAIWRARWIRMVVLIALLGATGCTSINSAFGPSFVDLFDPSGNSATVQNAPGHVAIVFINNADVDERLLNYLVAEPPEGGGVDLTPYERRNLRPRFRFRVRVDFTNGNSTLFEFIDGSAKLVDTRFDATSEPDLLENDLSNGVVVCDVLRVSVDGPIEVFIPVAIAGYQFQEASEQRPPTFVFRGYLNQSLRFIPLQVDATDADGNIILVQNISPRDIPVPVENPRCGSVVSISITGSLAVPFLSTPIFSSNDPSVRVDDAVTIARIGGRFQVRVQVN